MNASKPTTKKRLQITTELSAGAGYACVNQANGHTVFSGSSNDGGLLNALGGLCKSNGYTWMMF